MSSAYTVSTPSRLCLFGEHQDYLGLEVIAAAIGLRFCARAVPRKDALLRIRIRDEAICELGQRNERGLYEEIHIPLDQDIHYRNQRDYFASCIQVVRSLGCPLVRGADIQMDSNIPIGKGMCSSTTMVVAFLTALLCLEGHPAAQSPQAVAQLAWQAEVASFGEPGGMMDHYTSALGGLVHLDFAEGICVHPLRMALGGRFILFDSLQRKDTLQVLSRSKQPTLEGLRLLAPQGIHSIRDFYDHPEWRDKTAALPPDIRRRVEANIDNYAIQREAYRLLCQGQLGDEALGALLNRHHANLRDGLGISTPAIERILDTALAHGALGGKFNGSGGGGCLFVYARQGDCESILEAVRREGYPGMITSQDRGLQIVEDA